MADNIAAMISASNWMMRAWEMGNEAEYRALATPDFRMVSIIQFNYQIQLFCYECTCPTPRLLTFAFSRSFQLTAWM
jgi:hypothetical protein